MGETILKIDHITKSFSGNKALSDVDFDLNKNEIHCLCGENGAGKSTMIKLLTGMLTPDSGTIWVNGKSFSSLTPKKSQDLGIDAIYQENLLLGNMSVAENIFIGREKTNHLGLIDFKGMYAETHRMIDMLEVDISPSELVGNLSVANQQYVKIAKSLMFKPQILIMDEPTTMFNVTDTAKLLETMKKLRSQGISIIYISHKLHEVVEIADRVTVLRDGLKISCTERENISIEQITSDMIGRPLDMFYKREPHPIGDTILEVKDMMLAPNSPKVNFSLKQGEILGIAGMVGSGRTEIAQAIFGARKKYSGELILKGKPIKIRGPEDAIANGIGFITEDRQKTGLLLEMSINSNVTIAALKKLKGLFLSHKEEARISGEMTKRVNLKALNYDTDVRFLSGGNQQKVIVGKWIFRDCDIIIFDEPTRGIDVNSKAEIYALMVDLLKEGKSIIMISSDMPELISVSDRVLVIKDGSVAAELIGEEITEKNIISKTI